MSMRSALNSLNLLKIGTRTLGFVNGFKFCAAHGRGRGYTTLRINGHKLKVRNGSSDLHVFRSVVINREYEVDEFGNSHSLSAPAGSLVIDAGANVGISTWLLASRLPACTVIALEPDSANFGLLSENISGLQNVHALNAALWFEEGQGKLIDSGMGNTGPRVVASSDQSIADIRFETIASLQFKTGLPLSILKMDIEGAELEVFKGWPKTLSTTRKWQIFVELHDRFKAGCSQALIGLLSTAEQKYSVHPVGEKLRIDFESS